MLTDIISQLNWIDLVFVILLIRIGYVSLRNGFLVEIFKLLGTVLAIYLACHYYVSIAAFFNDRFAAESSSLAFAETMAFFFLCALGYGIFILPRLLLMRFLKVEVMAVLNKWGGLSLGICRGVLFSGILFLIFSITTADYLRLSLTHSYSGSWLVDVVSGTYGGLWKSVMSKFMRGEQYNDKLDSLRNSLRR